MADIFSRLMALLENTTDTAPTFAERGFFMGLIWHPNDDLLTDYGAGALA